MQSILNFIVEFHKVKRTANNLHSVKRLHSLRRLLLKRPLLSTIATMLRVHLDVLSNIQHYVTFQSGETEIGECTNVYDKIQHVLALRPQSDLVMVKRSRRMGRIRS